MEKEMKILRWKILNSNISKEVWEFQRQITWIFPAVLFCLFISMFIPIIIARNLIVFVQILNFLVFARIVHQFRLTYHKYGLKFYSFRQLFSGLLHILLLLVTIAYVLVTPLENFLIETNILFAISFYMFIALGALSFRFLPTQIEKGGRKIISIS